LSLISPQFNQILKRFQSAITFLALLASTTLASAITTAAPSTPFGEGLALRPIPYVDLQNEVANLNTSSTSTKLRKRLTSATEGVYLCSLLSMQ
jgi:hypothetical protein